MTASPSSVYVITATLGCLRHSAKLGVRVEGKVHFFLGALAPPATLGFGAPAEGVAVVVGGDPALVGAGVVLLTAGALVFVCFLGAGMSSLSSRKGTLSSSVDGYGLAGGESVG